MKTKKIPYLKLDAIYKKFEKESQEEQWLDEILREMENQPPTEEELIHMETLLLSKIAKEN